MTSTFTRVTFAGATMETTQVKDVVEKWRVLSNELKLLEHKKEEVVSTLNEQQSELSKARQEWELEKEKLRSTIQAVLADIIHKKTELQTIEEETAELRRKVDDRRLRNEEHLTVLSKRKKLVEEQLEAAQRRDEGVKERFAVFESSREEAKRQVLSAIRKVEEAGPQEEADYAQRVRVLRTMIQETEATIEAEAKSWALERAMREFNETCDARKWLLDEVSAAEEGKDLWADLLQEANSLSVSDSLQSLLELRSVVSA